MECLFSEERLRTSGFIKLGEKEVEKIAYYDFVRMDSREGRAHLLSLIFSDMTRADAESCVREV